MRDEHHRRRLVMRRSIVWQWGMRQTGKVCWEQWSPDHQSALFCITEVFFCECSQRPLVFSTLALHWYMHTQYCASFTKGLLHLPTTCKEVISANFKKYCSTHIHTVKVQRDSLHRTLSKQKQHTDNQPAHILGEISWKSIPCIGRVRSLVLHSCVTMRSVTLCLTRRWPKDWPTAPLCHPGGHFSGETNRHPRRLGYALREQCRRF